MATLAVTNDFSAGAAIVASEMNANFTDIETFINTTPGVLQITGGTVTGAVTLSNTLTVGADDTGYDVKLFGATTGKSWLWDEDADKMIVTGTTTLAGATQQTGTLTVGVDDTGYDVKFFGATSGAYMLWDEDVDDLVLAGDARLGVGIAATGTARLSVHGGLRFTYSASAADIYTGIGATGVDVLTLCTAGSEVLKISSAGRVGIGVGPTGTAKLALGGGLRFTAAASAADIYTGIGSVGTDIVALCTAGTEKVRVTSAGLVGIGRAPSYALDVETPNASSYVRFKITEAYSSYSVSTLIMQGGADAAASIWFGDSADPDIGGIHYYNSNNSMRFTVNTAERMRIDSDGQLGIGDTNPTYLLDIDEDVADAVPLHVEMSSGGTANQYLVRFSRNGALMTNGIYCDTGAAYMGTPSDERLKRDIATIDPSDSLAAITALRPVDFRFITDPDDGEIRNGLIAQEVELVIPAAVHTVTDSEPRRETVSVPRIELVDEMMSVPRTEVVVDDDGNETTIPVLDENGDQIIDEVMQGRETPVLDENGDQIFDEETHAVLDDNGQKIVDVTGDTKMMEWNALTSHMIGAIKELDARLAAVEAA